MSDWAQELKSSQKTGSSSLQDGSSGGSSWNKVNSNIGQTASDYKGNKDVSRMREVIQAKAQNN